MEVCHQLKESGYSMHILHHIGTIHHLNWRIPLVKTVLFSPRLTPEKLYGNTRVSTDHHPLTKNPQIMCEPFAWLMHTVKIYMVLWPGTLQAIQYIFNKWINQALGHSQAMGHQPPYHQWETGRIVHTHKTHSSMQSIPDQWAAPYPPHNSNPWPIVSYTSPAPPGLGHASYHELGPAINGSTHSLMCGTCVLPHHP